MRNPNRLRSLVGTFAAANLSQFNRKDGAGYEFVAKIVIETDRSNPQVAARLLGAFKTWRSLEPGRRSLAHAALKKLSSKKSCRPTLVILSCARWLKINLLIQIVNAAIVIDRL